MDHKLVSTAQIKPDHFQQVARRIRPNGQDSGGICFGIQVDNDPRMGNRMKDRTIVVSMLSGRPVNLHTLLL